MHRGTIYIATIAFVLSLSRADAGPVTPIDRAVIVAQAVKEHVDDNGRGESYWRQRADSLRQELEDQQVRYDAVIRQEQECLAQPVIYRGSSRDCASRYRSQKISIETQMERIRKRLDVDLPDEARKVGAYPGWLR